MRIKIIARKYFARKFFIAVAGLVSIHTAFGLALAQQQPAGVVTGIQGQAQLTRPAVAPSPLKFKDGVIIRDVVDTREKSLARILFGGRSTVTVRELSRLEVREELLPTGARRDVHDLSSGAILVNVARQLMGPGDEVQIRTPNAIAAVRGSVLFGSYNPISNQSFFAFVAGSGLVTPQGQPPITLTANTPNNGAYVTGTGPAIQVTQVTVTPAQANQIVSESQVAKVVKEEANKEQNVQAAAKEAAALATAVVEAVTKTEQTTGETKTEEQKQEEQKQETTQESTTEPSSDSTAAPVTADTSSAADEPDVKISGTKELTAAETPVETKSGKSFEGTGSRSGTTPVVEVTDAKVTQASGDTDSLIFSKSGSDWSLSGPVLKIQNSEINNVTSPSGLSLLEVSGKLTSTTESAFISIDPSTVKTKDDFIHIGAGGSLGSAASPLKSHLLVVTGTAANPTKLTAGGDFVEITGGGTLTGNTTASLLKFDNSEINVGSDGAETHFFRVTGSTSKASLAGPLVSGLDTKFTIKGSAALEVVNSGKLESTSTSAFVDITGGSLTLGSNVHGLFMNSSGVLDIKGSLLKVKDTTVTAGSGVPFAKIGGASSVTTGGSFLDLTNVNLDLGTQPVARVEGGSTVKTTAGPVIKISGGSLKADALANSDGKSNTFNLTGTVLDLSNTTVTVRTLGESPEGDTDTTKFTLAADEPFIKMSNDSKLKLTGTTDNVLIELDPDEFGATFKGVALIATGTDPLKSTLTLPDGLLDMEGIFSSTSTSPLVQLTNTTVNNTDDLIAVDFVTGGTNVTLSGQLLKSSGSTITVKNEDVNTVKTTVGVGTKPFDVAFAGDRAYVVNNGSNTVSIINIRTNTVEKTLSVGTGPRSIDREGSDILVVNSGSNNVSRIDPISNTVTNTFAVGTDPREVVILPDNDFAYVTNFGSNTVSVIDLETNSVSKTISVGSGPEGIAFSPDGKKVGVLNKNSGTVSVIKTADNTVEATITVGTKPVDGAFTLTGNKAYIVNEGSDNVSLINTTNNTVIATIAVGDGPHAIAITPDDKKAYVANELAKTVSVIDTATNTVKATISVGTEPGSVDISPDGKRAYVANFGSNNVSVINTENDTVIATVNVGTGPGTIALTRGGTRAFVLNESSNNVSVVDTIDPGNFLAIEGGAILKSTSTTLPLLEFNPSALDLGGNLVSITGSGSKLDLSSPLLKATDSSFNVRRILRVRDGGVLTSSTTGALIELTGTAADKSKVDTISTFASIDQLDTTDKAPQVSLAGPFLNATKTTFKAGTNSINKSTFIIVADGALLKSTGTDPLITFDGSTLDPSFRFLQIESPDSAGTGAKVEVAGRLVDAKNSSTFKTEGDFIAVRDKGTLKGTGATALIQSNGSTFTIGSDVQGFGSFLSLDDNTTVSSNGGATVDLAGPLFQDTGSTFDILTRFINITGSSTLTSTSADPLLRFTDGTVDTDRNFVGVFDTSTLETKALLKATNTDFTAGTSTNDNSFLFVGSSSTLKGTGTDPFVIFETGSTLDTAGNFLTIRDSNSSTAPSTVSLAGPLLKATDSTFTTASCCSFLFIGEGGKLDGTGTGALFQLTNSTFDVGFDFVTVADSSPTTAKMDLKGALVSDSGSTFTIGRRFLRVRDGSTLSTTSSDPLISLSGSTVSTKDDFIRIEDSGSKVTLSGSLLSAGSTLNIGTDATLFGDLLDIRGGGQLVMNSSNAVVQFTGGTHTIGTGDSTSNDTPNRIFRLAGVNTNATTGLGTDQPIKGPASSALSGATNPIGTLLKATDAATIEVKKGAGDTSGGNAVRIDTALYEATLPILDLVGSSTTETTLKTAQSTIDIFKSKVVSQGPVVAMDKSFINVTNGAFINLTGGTEWKVTGDLLKLFNGAKIEVINGPLILVSGTSSSGSSPPQSLLDVSGALVNFGGSGNNKIIVNNTLCSGACATKGGSGVQAIQVKEGSTGSITIGSNPIKNSSLGTITYQGSNTALIQTGSKGKVNITAP